jgi:hypothetical protein
MTTLGPTPAHYNLRDATNDMVVCSLECYIQKMEGGAWPTDIEINMCSVNCDVCHGMNDTVKICDRYCDACVKSKSN